MTNAHTTGLAYLDVRRIMMRIAQFLCSNGVFKIVCSGDYGVGTAGNASAAMLVASINDWLAAQADEADTLKIDYAGAVYSWVES